MGTNIRPEISERNPYWISKHRYYELKHFCLQYNGWASAYKALDGKMARPLLDGRASGGAGDPTEKCAERRVYYADRMAMVRQAASDATADFHEQLLLAVTEALRLVYRLVDLCCDLVEKQDKLVDRMDKVMDEYLEQK